MPNWGEQFIKLYTDEEKQSLESVISELFRENVLIELRDDLLSEICKIWWVVLGCFGNTALFSFVSNDPEVVNIICEEADIRSDIFTYAIKGLVANNVDELSQNPEELDKYVSFLFFDLVNIFTDITDASLDDLMIKEHPDLKLMQKFYSECAKIMDLGSATWQKAMGAQLDDYIKSIDTELPL